LELIAKKRNELLSVVEPQGDVGKQLSLFWVGSYGNDESDRLWDLRGRSLSFVKVITRVVQNNQS